ncbi:hypothetical protein, variant 1 [Aphanomyces invadans]|uniref:Calponin-homology (CH) domain-containing protein n=1 Tax=Aphanomyces invadans TaxID=157072 RepID=A0A024TZV2_9STRA|nr:hypothetical protein, variant 1 [Aphanomyces invadans]ETV99176.1 hypothetical protein, variant 1 [Aphanomyces invadans]|eukprot:XP_008871732.1 hypothetical protein, variant 1 [Aphanomyces invadans]
MEPPYVGASSLPRVYRPIKSPVDTAVRATTADSHFRPKHTDRTAALLSFTTTRGRNCGDTQPSLRSHRHPVAPSRKPQPNTPLQPRDEVGILYPFSNIADDDGSMHQIMWSKWHDQHAADTLDDNFTSFALYGEMKLQEAQTMSSWLEQPNQFLTAVACTLLDKFAERLGTSGGLMRRLLHALMAAVYVRRPTGDDVASTKDGEFDRKVPHFIESKRLRRTCLELLDENTRKHADSSIHQVGVEKMQRVIEGTAKTWKRKVQRLLFYNWTYLVQRRRRIRTFMDRTFRYEVKATVKETFRAWRVEALRRAYYRESANYQAMLSVTAESLGRKDIQLNEAATRTTELQAQVDQLASINSQLVMRIQELEATNRSMRAAQGAPDAEYFVPAKAQFEPMDTIVASSTSETEEDHKVNRLLLESLFAMARMVESSVIQSSSDIMDSLRHQTDGHELRDLSELMFKQTQLYGKQQPSMASSSTVHDHHSIQNLLTKPIDVVLLNWMRLQLDRSTATTRPQDKIIRNFSEDLADGHRFALLLHHLYPKLYDTALVGEIDVDTRLQHIERFNRECPMDTSADATLPAVVTAESIANQKSHENFVFIAMLFGLHQAHYAPVNIDKARKAFLHIVTCWKKVRTIMLDVRRAADDTPDKGLVLSLVKELKTCENYHKEMQCEITSQACTSNETSTVLIKLTHKILCFTWRLLAEKLQGVHEDVVDERRAHTMQKFTVVSPVLVRDIILGNPDGRRTSLSETEVLTRVAGIQKVLQQWFKELCAIFRHYSCGALRGRATTMSSGEWAKFIKDCAIVDKKVTQAIAEAVYYQCVNSDKTIVQTTTAAKEMSPSMFVSALVLLADKKYPQVMFEDRIGELIEKCVIPHACRSQPEVFRMLLQTSDVRGVYQKFKQPLQRTFKYYSSVKADEVLKSTKPRSTIGLVEFVMMVKDCKLIGSYVTENTVKQIFVLVQRHNDDDEWGGDITGNEELQVNYVEFEEVTRIVLPSTATRDLSTMS